MTEEQGLAPSSDFGPADLIEKVKWLGRVYADPDLSASAKATAAAFFLRHNTRSGRLDPGAQDLAQLASLSRRGAQLARDQLISRGYLGKTERAAGPEGHRRNLTNAYRLEGCAPPRSRETPSLRSMAYEEYLKSEHWRGVRLRALRDAGYSCQICESVAGLEVHHRTYARRGREMPSDVIALCGECHQLFHDAGRMPGRER